MEKKKVSFEELLGIKKMQEIAIERLHPPSEILVDAKDMDLPSGKQYQTDSKLAIDFNSMPNEYWDYCNSSDARRAWKRAKFGTSHRGTTKQLKRDVEKITEDLDIVKLMKKQQKPLFIGVMNEYKAKLAKLKEKGFEG